jgi:hypothetical protein
MSTKLEECLRYAGSYVVNSHEEYYEHLIKIKQAVFYADSDPSYPFISWMYATEAYELQNNISPSGLIKMLDS